MSIELIHFLRIKIMIKVTAEELLEMYHDGERNFSKLDLSGIDLSFATVRENIRKSGNIPRPDIIQLSYSDFTGVDLTDANFSGVNLIGAIFEDDCILNGINFSKAKMLDVSFAGVLKHCDFTGADLRCADFFAVIEDSIFDRAQMIGCKFEGRIRKSTFISCNLRGADFYEGDFINVDCSNAFLNGVDTNRCYIANVNFTNTCLKGADGDLIKFIEKVVAQGQLDDGRINNVIFDNTIMPNGSILTGRTAKV